MPSSMPVSNDRKSRSICSSCARAFIEFVSGTYFSRYFNVGEKKKRERAIFPLAVFRFINAGATSKFRRALFVQKKNNRPTTKCLTYDRRFSKPRIPDSYFESIFFYYALSSGRTCPRQPLLLHTHQPYPSESRHATATISFVAPILVSLTHFFARSFLTLSPLVHSAQPHATVSSPLPNRRYPDE